MQRGKTRNQVERIAERLGVPYGSGESGKADPVVASVVDDATGCPRAAECSAVASSLAAVREEMEAALRMAKEATNSWACYAKTSREHDTITRLHREIDDLKARLARPAEKEK